MDLLILLKHMLHRAIQANQSFFTTKKMSHEDLLEAIQRELVGARALQTTIQGNIRTLDSKLSNLNELVQQLIDQAEGCSICCQPFSQPMKTPCGHVFCNHCITEWLAPEARTSCPTCRERVALVDLSSVVVPAPTTTPAVEDVTSTNSVGDAAQEREQTFANFDPGRSAQATGDLRQSPAQATQQTPARHRGIQAQPRQNASSRTPRSTRALRPSPNGSNVKNTPGRRPPRPLLTVLRSISSFGPTVAEREEIQSILERGESNNIQIQASSHPPIVKEDANMRWRQVIDAHSRITRMPMLEKQKIAEHVEWLEYLVRR